MNDEQNKQQTLAEPIRYLELRTVGVKFVGNVQVYSYYVPDSDDPQIGDIVVTSVLDSNNATEDDGLGYGKGFIHFAKIVTVDVFPAPKATKFYLKLVSMQELRDRKEQNGEMLRKVAERKQLMEKLDTLLLQQSKIEHYKKLAETNPEAKVLLEKLLNS